ncbi:glycoside hydrolase family 5 protein [Ramlibacter tataouinensis]|uniref:Candidate endo-1,4-glucanase, Glycoside Hydrolase Family 5 n=1 Tax=Ramlibacter tataouinensis (strain ATCC BAA-407 / DSM 14655 / LMG 21543 / TTB310) TaxID=365046 RepID=F5Y099_RAMTT|nr:glycoside hydrolase family 5 protein [Ramlibacter tataouinensis]AEG92121.1 candidate endo-1,4-glucanase, Glycoside Hydrolase Family 5 [Ramlibacter tataouinensis TTB310]
MNNKTIALAVAVLAACLSLLLSTASPGLASPAGASAPAARSAAPTRPQQNCRAVTERTCAVAHALGRGINLGNMLEAPREGDWGIRLEPGFIDIAARHFQTVRLPVRWTNHAAPTADATIDEAFARRVDGVVDALLAKGVYVILNVHHYSQIHGDQPHQHEFTVDPALLETRLVNIWRQLGQRYQNRSPRLLFELLNEPHGRLDGEPWNQLIPQALAAVRATNPERPVLVGPSYWNNVRDLPKLRLPRDRNLIVAIHTYEPFNFTHQGVSWRPDLRTGQTCCDSRQRREMADPFEKAERWNREQGYPLHLGEFGAHSAGEMGSRAEYTRLVRDEAERRGIGWTYWEFGSEFAGVWSPETRGWVEPIRRALLD